MYNQSRVIIENITPLINCGEFPLKSVVNEIIPVTADIFADGHDVIAASVLFKHEKEKSWKETRMHPAENDQWNSSFQVNKQGFYQYKIQGWVDHALNWQHGIQRKIEDGQTVNSELLEGAMLLEVIIEGAAKNDKTFLLDCIASFRHPGAYEKATEMAQSDKLHRLLVKHPTKLLHNESQVFTVYVDRLKARYSTWYEFFPRSASDEEGKHGTFKDCERLLPRVASMGFDTLYFPPIHPIGEVNRKGKNNTTVAKKDDVGSTWGIGSKLGGHKDIHPELGSLKDFKDLVKAAEKLGIEIAMDFALQAAPDHPWVKDHPEWFKWRPDGTVQYAENPPKKYQDILPIHFESGDWKNLWKDMLDTALYWIEECGIKVFRVDNPHTKPFYFWGWLISEVKKKHKDILFLSEAFTRPKIMHQLAKQGFTQSYTYFTWRNSKHELIEYMEELTKTDQQYFFRPNFWPNTPDINPWSLQSGNEAMHLQRYFLAATLSSNTGVYGPVFEQMVSAALPGREEYLDSEKFQIRHWDWEKQNKLTTLITKINMIRKEHTSLQQTKNIQFLSIENEQILAYHKYSDDREDETLMIVNLDPHYPQNGWVQLPMGELGVQEGQRISVTDLITGSSYHWDKEWNFVELHPALPFHLFKIGK
ncbi:MAG: alpha-1,4-glucan--maltose-1-phosphate maltosyltransferase [Bacteroidia bacterium]|nr:alpha-1,4-glucan--maltose-1-phosphate maltosyltransferase [Bacteroidia bacterium]NNF31069.1 alpha-1,4-glucan--maltose-1-phosphate maltosyltransferase [Flavobacteriaceae bacterium]MBT8276967.1 alpha-1,4-glucan--maltose-1-phosphate maltosyltransferase [Bacteroidia bacterium]NNJ81770.1 alpha-1,4-glucan--maltose-1-phosphate maltosyltransferase [Flavobacteriaceae bacterium]NNK55302.1 alpha-1,4-glucan--maltose-1-phosphate maltosyltransferase [Flavobacteriaceae bacterium]